MKKIWIQTLFLSLSLALVIGLIQKLKSSPEWVDKLSLAFYGSEAHDQLDWCQTRVTKIEAPNKFKVFQEGLKWFKTDLETGNRAELGFIPVEKWFANYCRLFVQGKTEGLATELKGPDEELLADVKFVDGTSSQFMQIAPEIFTWNKTTFRSPELKKALDDLSQLPKVGGTETNTKTQ